MKKKINIMLTCVGGKLMPELVHQIKKSKKFNFFILGVDVDSNAIGKYFCDEFRIVMSGKKKKEYKDQILNLINDFKIQIIIPTSDEEAITLSEIKNEIKKRKCILASGEESILKILNNKIKTYDFLERKSLCDFRWRKILSYDDFKKFSKQLFEFNETYIFKSADDRGSRNIFFIKSKKVYNHIENSKYSLDDIKDLLQKNKNASKFFIMEELCKPVYDIDMLTWEGELFRCIQRKRIHSDFPNEGHEIVKNKLILKFCKRIAKEFNLSGLYDCDFMFNKKNKPVLLEINPRQSGSIAISLVAGFKLIDDLVQLLLGNKIKKSQKFINKVIIPYQSLKIIKNVKSNHS